MRYPPFVLNVLIHNIGGGVREEGMLFDYAVTGRYRYPRR